MKSLVNAFISLSLGAAFVCCGGHAEPSISAVAPAPWRDVENKFQLRAPGPDWTVAKGEGGVAATITDGMRCHGEVRVEAAAPKASARDHLEAQRDAALARYTNTKFRMFEAALYCGQTAHRYELFGRAKGEDRQVDERATAVGEGSRMYLVRAWSSATAPTERRRCLDAVMAAFDPLL